MYSPRRNILSLVLSFTLLAAPAMAQQVIATVPVGAGPIVSSVDSGRNHIYVLNQSDGSVSDIDGATNLVVRTVPLGVFSAYGAINPVTGKGYIANTGSQRAANSVIVLDLGTYNTTPVTVGFRPSYLAVNSLTNKIYVANACGTDSTCASGSNGNVSVIDGATNTVIATIVARMQPSFVVVNPVTNKIYVANKLSDNLTVIDGATNTVITTIALPTGARPNVIAVNTLTNKLYVNDQGLHNVTVVNGASDSVITTLVVGNNPSDSSVNLVTNKIYVANQNDNTVSVIDGATDLVVKTVTVGFTPVWVRVDIPTNKTYVANKASNTVTMIDGNSPTYSTTTVNVRTFPQALTVNPATNTVYVSNFGSNNVSVIRGATAAAARFVAVSPCRVYDTRPAGGGGGPIPGGGSQSFTIPQLSQLRNCGNIPANVAAYSLNVTAIPHSSLGYLSIWPTGEDQPLVSTMNSLDGRIKADAVIVPAGYQGAINVYVTNTSDVALDIDGYFAPISGATLAFYPLAPCRVADTRDPSKPAGLGPPLLSAATPRDFPVLSSSCIPAGANPQAYSLNFTVVPPGGAPVGYLSVWPNGQPQPVVSTLNDNTGTITANAAIVPAGIGGDIIAYATNNTQLIIDINGYFAPAIPGGLSLYSVQPCRVLDTRPVPFSGMLSPPVDVVNSRCQVSSLAQAYVFNATVVPPGALSYLTLWPDGINRPIVSTLNALDGSITSNMAIVPGGTNGKIDAYAAGGLTQLILDISSYFAP